MNVDKEACYFCNLKYKNLIVFSGNKIINAIFHRDHQHTNNVIGDERAWLLDCKLTEICQLDMEFSNNLLQ